MLNNHVYNLLAQFSEEHKSLWRIREHYLKEAEGCPECMAFWEKLAKDKTAHIQELAALLKKEL